MVKNGKVARSTAAAWMTLLIAVQQSVGRAQLGIATSLNQLSRSIGGAVGVAAALIVTRPSPG